MRTRYCYCESGHIVLAPAEEVNEVLHAWCPDCQRIIQVTAVLMRDGMLHWMPGDWRGEAEPDLFSQGIYVYN